MPCDRVGAEKRNGSKGVGIENYLVKLCGRLVRVHGRWLQPQFTQVILCWLVLWCSCARAREQYKEKGGGERELRRARERLQAAGYICTMGNVEEHSRCAK